MSGVGVVGAAVTTVCTVDHCGPGPNRTKPRQTEMVSSFLQSTGRQAASRLWIRGRMQSCLMNRTEGHTQLKGKWVALNKSPATQKWGKISGSLVTGPPQTADIERVPSTTLKPLPKWSAVDFPGPLQYHVNI